MMEKRILKSREQAKYILLLLVMVSILSLSTGCGAPEKVKATYFNDRETTWDGYVDGMGLVRVPDGVPMSSAYMWGLWLGRIWVFIGVIMTFAMSSDESLGFFGFIAAYIGILIIGAGVYWMFHFIIVGAVWLYECMEAFIVWLKTRVF